MGQEVTVESAAPAAVPAKLPPEPAAVKLSHRKTAFLIALPVLLLLYVIVAAGGVYSQTKHRRLTAETIQAAEKPAPNGPKLYAENCAKCHGIRGNADGVTSTYLDPWARRFGEEKFQFASTENGVPTDDDLIYIIEHGIPGTGMPPFDHLSREEQLAVAGHVRLLTFAGLYAKLYRQEAKFDEPFPDAIHDRTVKQLTPGPVREVPKDLPAPTPASIERGRKLFGTSCATCHGPQGAGDGPQVKDMKRDNGQPIKPRDLRRGVFMAGGEPERLYLRIALGIPGTPMPASATLKPSEIGDLVNFVRSLSQNAGEANAAQ